MKVSLFLLDDYFDPHSANACVKPKICMRQMTQEISLICIIQQNNESVAQKMQPWQNTAMVMTKTWIHRLNHILVVYI